MAEERREIKAPMALEKGAASTALLNKGLLIDPLAFP